MHATRPHPNIAIPPGAAPPTNPSPVADGWDFLVTPPERDPLGLWSESHRHSSFTPATPLSSSLPHDITFPVPDHSSRPPSRASSAYESAAVHHARQEPSLHRSTSQRASLRPSPTVRSAYHRPTKSEVTLTTPTSSSSRPPSFIEGSSGESTPELASTQLPDDVVSKNLLDDESRLRHFQKGTLMDVDEEWYKLVPAEAQNVLGKEEVLRQSVLFELIKSEREYVRDLEAMKQVFIRNLRDYSPIPPKRVEAFIAEVFCNLDPLLRYHQEMLVRLFNRQMEQHPIIQGVADIVLSTTVEFGPAYEEYIKHYPLAEARHRAELRRNPAYQSFLFQCSDHPRVRRRDLITFLSRPVTRLPRLALLLQTIDKHTAPELDDKKDLPLILELLNKYIKSSQPGIEAAESKVKFWALCESLIYQKGEIIDMDLYDQSRTLLHAGALFRRYRSKADVSHTWAELHVALLDNYLLILRPEERPNGAIRYGVVSRPIPLEYLRLGSFDGTPELRKEKEKMAGYDIPMFRSSRTVKVYPFKVYHSSSPNTRAYTFFAPGEAERDTWKAKLMDALEVRKVGQDANKLFAPLTVNEGFFKASGLSVSNLGARFTGKITCAAPFSSNGRNFVAIGCPSGVYVMHRDESRPKPKKVLQLSNPKSLYALQDFNRFVILFDGGLHAYSLDLLGRVALQLSTPQSLDKSLERISGSDAVVLFAKVGKIGQRTMVLYTTKSFLQVSLHALSVVHPSEINLNPNQRTPSSFRVFGEPASISKDVHDITALHRHIGICTERGIQMADPTNLNASTQTPTVVPNFNSADGNPPMQTLQRRCAGAKPLGLVRCDDSQLIVIYNNVGCYINKDGTPARSSGYLRWETRADSFAHRGAHLILVSSSFIEIRSLNTGKLVQVIEGSDMRLVHSSERSVMVTMKNDAKSGSELEYKLVELVETANLEEQQLQEAQMRTPGVRASQKIWDEWDM
ncbi:hypothetical protein EIP91_007912 [Steccherinum ochraceum]|uniref:RHO1 GDP-GTP exchange protein 2 n=1 Tax=Steccherinum ochraceum TaxID=92696 RepID=A0A4R0RNV3_9APHY|nr:hypothetical protein EIP91_007912 [Steccherinum ochraceum]